MSKRVLKSIKVLDVEWQAWQRRSKESGKKSVTDWLRQVANAAAGLASSVPAPVPTVEPDPEVVVPEDTIGSTEAVGTSQCKIVDPDVNHVPEGLRLVGGELRPRVDLKRAASGLREFNSESDSVGGDKPA